jgi:hypothetical protein
MIEMTYDTFVQRQTHNEIDVNSGFSIKVAFTQLVNEFP